MKIVGFSIRRPVTVTMLFLAIAVFGTVSYSKLALNLLPEISYPTLTIRTNYEGAAPAEIENLITKPVEDAVSVVNNVVRVSSVSKPEVSDVILEFSWRTDMDFAGLDVREKLDLLQLPLEADKPILLRYDPSSDPIMRVSVSGSSDLSAIRYLCEEFIRSDLESIDGVAAVRVSGGFEEEIQVELDEQRLASLGVSIQEVTSRLAQENINLRREMAEETASRSAREAAFRAEIQNQQHHGAQVAGAAAAVAMAAPGSNPSGASSGQSALVTQVGAGRL